MTAPCDGGQWDHSLHGSRGSVTQPFGPAAHPLEHVVGLDRHNGEDRGDVEVSAGGKVWHRPSSAEEPIEVRGSKSVHVRCPTGSDVVVGRALDRCGFTDLSVTCEPPATAGA